MTPPTPSIPTTVIIVVGLLALHLTWMLTLKKLEQRLTHLESKQTIKQLIEILTRKK